MADEEVTLHAAVANYFCKGTFESRIKGLKGSQNTKKSSVNKFFDEDFYYHVKKCIVHVV